MKKLSVCRNCKRRFLIEPGQDNCPKCGGPLYKTDLDEQYWDLYSEDQRAEIFSKLMVEMEQNTGADAGSTAPHVAGGAGSAFKRPAVLVGLAAACILLAAAFMTISGKTRKEASGTVTAEASVAESVTALTSASSEEAEAPDELEPAGPNEDNPDLSNSETVNPGPTNPEPANPESADSEHASSEPAGSEAAAISSADTASASSGTSGDPTIDYILSHTEAAREAGASGQAAANAQNPEASAAGVSGASGVSGSNAAGSTGTSASSGASGSSGAGGNGAAVQRYVYKGITLDLPVDAEIMPQGPGIYAYLYTRDNMDVIAFKYEETGPLDLSAARAMTKAEMEDFIASQNDPGYDGLLSFSVSEINGYPMIMCSYHATGDSLILVTEKSIYQETGYYRIYTFDITGENTDALNAALDSVRLTR